MTGAGAATLLLPQRAEATPQVPVSLQAELISKAAKYDRNLESRVDGRLRLMTLHDGSSTDSEAVALLF